MPEGHTIHRMAKDHGALFRGQVVQVSSPQGRFKEGAQRVSDTRFLSTSAHGKHLFYHFESGQHGPLNVHIHLGLFGKFLPAGHGHDIRTYALGFKRLGDLLRSMVGIAAMGPHNAGKSALIAHLTNLDQNRAERCVGERCTQPARQCSHGYALTICALGGVQ